MADLKFALDNLKKAQDSVTALSNTTGQTLGDFSFIERLQTNLEHGDYNTIPAPLVKLMANFCNELSKQMTVPKGILVSQGKEHIDKLNASVGKFTAIVSQFESLSAVQETERIDVSKRELLKCFRFLGIDIAEDSTGTFVNRGSMVGSRDEEKVEPDQISKNGETKDFMPITEKSALKILNDRELRHKVLSGFNVNLFLARCRNSYRSELFPSNLTGKYQNLINKFRPDSPEYLSFSATDKYLQRKNLLEFFQNELIISNGDSLNAGLNAKDVMEGLVVDMIGESKKYCSEYQNIILSEYQTALDKLSAAANKDRFEDEIGQIQDAGLKLVAIKEICTKHGDIVKGLTGDQLSQFIDSFNVLQVSGTMPKISLKAELLGLLNSWRGPDNQLTQKEFDGINKNLDNLSFENFEILKSGKQAKEGQPKVEEVQEESEEAEDSAEEVQEESEEELEDDSEDEQEEEDENQPTNDIPLLKIIRTIGIGAPTTYVSIGNIHWNIYKDYLFFAIDKMDKDTQLTYEEWQQIIPEIFTVAVAGMNSTDPVRVQLEAAKTAKTPFKLPDEFFDPNYRSGIANDVDLSYAALAKLKANHPYEKIEYIPFDKLNSELSQIMNELKNNPNSLTQAEKDLAENLKKKFRYLSASDHEKEATGDAKKTLSKILDSQEFGNADDKKKLAKECEEEPTLKGPESAADGGAPTWVTYAEKNNIKDTESIVKKLKGYNTKYLSKLLGDMMKVIQKTKIRLDSKSKVGNPGVPGQDTLIDDHHLLDGMRNAEKQKEDNPEPKTPETPAEENPKPPETPAEENPKTGEENPQTPKTPAEEKAPNPQMPQTMDIANMIKFLTDNKKDIISTSMNFDDTVVLADKTRNMFGNLIALTNNSPIVINDILKDVYDMNFESVSAKINTALKTVKQSDFMVPEEKLNKIKQDLLNYFANYNNNKESDCQKAFRKILFAGGDFVPSADIDYAALIKAKTSKTKASIEKQNSDYLNKVIEEIANLEKVVGSDKAIEIIGKIAVTSPTNMTKVDGEEKSEIVVLREQLKNDAKDYDFSALLSMNPQILLEILCAFPNKILGDDKSLVQDKEQTIASLSIAMFDQDYNIKDNIDTLTAVVGKEKAKEYIDALKNAGDADKKQAIINALQAQVKIPLDYLNKADSKVLNDMIEQGAISLYPSVNDLGESEDHDEELEI